MPSFFPFVSQPSTRSLRIPPRHPCYLPHPNHGLEFVEPLRCKDHRSRRSRYSRRLVSSGLSKLGYTFVNIDGHWQGNRDANGTIQSNPATFGDMKQLGDYIHSKGLKYGIYSGPGPVSCGGNTTSYGHEDQDAATFAIWGVDYLKYDLCSFRILMKQAEDKGGHPASTKLMIDAYKKMELALEKTHRPIYFALCQYGMDYVWTWAPDVRGTMWRTTMDIKDNWDSMTSIGFAQAGLSSFAGPGHYNDPDSLEIGNGHMTADEYRTQMSLWSIMAAPLILGNDVTKMDKETLEIVGNPEVIAIDQDCLRFRIRSPQRFPGTASSW